MIVLNNEICYDAYALHTHAYAHSLSPLSK